MMTQSVALKSFALGAQEGATQHPLDILGAEMLAKMTNDDTHGTVAIFHPMSGPPLHRHPREDKWVYVLGGQITFEIDGQQTRLTGGRATRAATIVTGNFFRDRVSYAKRS
jgi:quercetin dioxygenase-like cupin family protein